MLTLENSHAPSLYLSDELSDVQLEILRDCGLKERCPEAFNDWAHRNSTANLARQTAFQAHEAEAKGKLAFQNASKLQNIMLHGLIKDIMQSFP
jgi:hypothetical protein